MQLPLTDSSSEDFVDADDQPIAIEVPRTPLSSCAKPPAASTSCLTPISDTEQQLGAQSKEEEVQTNPTTITLTTLPPPHVSDPMLIRPTSNSPPSKFFFYIYKSNDECALAVIVKIFSMISMIEARKDNTSKCFSRKRSVVDKIEINYFK